MFYQFVSLIRYFEQCTVGNAVRAILTFAFTLGVLSLCRYGKVFYEPAPTKTRWMYSTIEASEGVCHRAYFQADSTLSIRPWQGITLQGNTTSPFLFFLCRHVGSLNMNCDFVSRSLPNLCAERQIQK